jgi:hypothetical protein
MVIAGIPMEELRHTRPDPGAAAGATRAPDRLPGVAILSTIHLVASGSSTAMTAFTYERDLDHPVSAEVEQTIRNELEELLSQSTICVRRALWKISEHRFPHLRYDFHEDQKILGKENW